MRDQFRHDYGSTVTGFHVPGLPVELYELATDMTCLSRMLNDANAGHRPPLPARAFHGTLLLLGYRLINMHPLGQSRPDSTLENAIHLGLVAFMMPFMHRLDGKIPDTPLLTQLLRSALETDHDVCDTAMEALLWVMLVGWSAEFMRTANPWLVSKISKTMHLLHIDTWEDVSQRMAKYPWIEAFHGPALLDLCITQGIFADELVEDLS